MAVVLLDACVLYPAALRDIFMWLAVEMVCRPRWTETIHEEWMRNVLEDRPDLSPERLERTRRLMDQIDPESLVSGYESRVADLSLPDEDDRHVLAAAIEARATVIVTFNLADFPESATRPHGVKALPPDVFVSALFEEEPGVFLGAIRKRRASLRRPPKSVEEYLNTLRTHGLVVLASQLKPFADEI